MIFPHLYLDSILELELNYLQQNGIRGLYLDVDGTLKNHGAIEIGSEVVGWMQQIRESGVTLCLCSNGRATRIEQLAQTLDIPFIAEAYKPFPFRCRRALRERGLLAHEIAMVGDQIYADVLVGRLSRMHTILIKPTSRVEPWFTRLKRPFETPILWKLRRAKRRLEASLQQALDVVSSSPEK
jgi:HAD superfamily phosphatase (TIGR01668 family)